jgi:hypothetical protein
MSLTCFLDHYGSEEQCREALAKARWPNALYCPDCGGPSHCHLKRPNVHQCNRCKRQVSLTSGTVIAETKLPLRTWFLAIYLLTQGRAKGTEGIKSDISAPGNAQNENMGVPAWRIQVRSAEQLK